MILKALYDYYNRSLLEDPNSLPLYGWMNARISFVIVIQKNGRFVRLEDCRDKKGKGKIFVLPYGIHTNAITPFLFWDKCMYAIDYSNASIPLNDTERKDKIKVQKWEKSYNSAHEKYLAFVDADDWVKPNYLEKLYAAAETEGADIVRILFEEYNERDKSCIPCDRRYRTYAAHRPVPFTPAERLRAGQDDTQVWGKLIARALVIGGQLGFCTGAVAEDVSFEILLYLQARHIIFLNEYLYVYRVGVDTSITADKPAMARGILQNLCFLCPELERRGFALPEIYEVLLRLLVKGIRRFRRLSPDARDLEVIEKTRKMIEKYRFYCYFGPRWKYGWFVRLTNGGGMKRMIFWSRLLR